MMIGAVAMAIGFTIWIAALVVAIVHLSRTPAAPLWRVLPRVFEGQPSTRGAFCFGWIVWFFGAAVILAG